MTETENKIALANLDLLVSNLNDQVSELHLDVCFMFYLGQLNDESQNNAIMIVVESKVILIEVLSSDVEYGGPTDCSNRTFDGWSDLLTTINAEPSIRLKNLDLHTNIPGTDTKCIVSDFGVSTYRVSMADLLKVALISNGNDSDNDWEVEIPEFIVK